MDKIRAAKYDVFFFFFVNISFPKQWRIVKMLKNKKHSSMWKYGWELIFFCQVLRNCRIDNNNNNNIGSECALCDILLIKHKYYRYKENINNLKMSFLNDIIISTSINNNNNNKCCAFKALSDKIKIICSAISLLLLFNFIY